MKYLNEAAESAANPLAEDIAVKHDYRNVKVADGMTITIDLEEIKRKMKEDFYKELSPFNYGA